MTWWQIYDEFTPLPMKQFDDRTLMKMDTYDAALDEFFSKIEGQRADQQRKAQEDSAFSKLDRIRADQVFFRDSLCFSFHFQLEFFLKVDQIVRYTFWNKLLTNSSMTLLILLHQISSTNEKVACHNQQRQEVLLLELLSVLSE